MNIWLSTGLHGLQMSLKTNHAIISMGSNSKNKAVIHSQHMISN